MRNAGPCIWSVKIAGAPPLVIREPGNRNRDSATLKIAQVTGRIGRRSRHRFGRARVKLRAAKMTADHVIALAAGDAIQLHISGGIKERSCAVPLLAVLANRRED